LGVVDHDQQRLLLGETSQSVQHCQPHEQRIRRRPGLEPERDAKRGLLRPREPTHTLIAQLSLDPPLIFAMTKVDLVRGWRER